MLFYVIVRRRLAATPARPQAPPTPHPALIHQSSRAAQRPVAQQETPRPPLPPPSQPLAAAPSTPLPQSAMAFIPPG